MHRLRGRIGRHFAVVLGVTALSLGAFTALPASADGPQFGNETVLEATLVFATSDGTQTVHCSITDDGDNWDHVDEAECPGLGDIDGESVELDLDVFDEGLCEGVFEDELWVNDGNTTLIYAKLMVVDIFDEGHNPAVRQTRSDCTGYGIPTGDDFEVTVSKDFSDNSLLAVKMGISGTNVNTELTSDSDHAIEGVETVSWDVWTKAVAYHAYGVLYSYDVSDDPHLLTGVVVVPSIYNEFGEDLATNLNGLLVSPPVPGGTATVTETVPAGYTPNQTACANIAISVFGGSKSCTIVNTVTPAATTPSTPAAAAAGAGASLPSFTG